MTPLPAGRCFRSSSETRTVANMKRRLERLGYHVTLERTTQAA